MAEVVKAEAAAGVSEEEQAHFAAQAVAAAAAKAKKAKLAEHESLILTSIAARPEEAMVMCCKVRAAENVAELHVLLSRIVSSQVGLSSKQAEAILDVAASMTPEEQVGEQESIGPRAEPGCG